MGPLVYAFLGSCKDVNIGPTAILALMVQPYVNDYGPDMAVLITFLAGCIIFVLGILHLGKKIQSYRQPKLLFLPQCLLLYDIFLSSSLT